MQVRFAALAKIEFEEARAWYRDIRPELGCAFTAEVRTDSQRLAHMPLMYPLEVGDIRRCVLRQFPYTLRYAVRGDLIVDGGAADDVLGALAGVCALDRRLCA